MVDLNNKNNLKLITAMISLIISALSIAYRTLYHNDLLILIFIAFFFMGIAIIYDIETRQILKPKTKSRKKKNYR